MFSNSVKLFELKGFQIKVDPSWLLIAALIVWSLSTGYFPQVIPGLSSAQYLTMAVAAMLGLFISLILHELSHSLVARRFGLGIGGITLFLFGGVAELESEPENARSEFWIAVAGPAMSFALAAGFWLLGNLAAVLGLPSALVSLVGYLALINLVLAVFNLLPAFPLDGGRVFRSILWAKSGDLTESTRKASRLGGLFGYALILLGLIALFAGGMIGGLWEVLIGLYLLAVSRATYQQVVTKSALKDKTVSVIMTPAPFTVAPSQTLAEVVNQVMLRHGVSFVPVVGNGVLLGHIDIHILKETDPDKWENTAVGDVFAHVEPDHLVAPETPAQEVLERIGSTGRRKYMVADSSGLIGVVTLSDLTGYLSISQQIGLPAD